MKSNNERIQENSLTTPLTHRLTWETQTADSRAHCSFWNTDWVTVQRCMWLTAAAGPCRTHMLQASSLSYMEIWKAVLTVLHHTPIEAPHVPVNYMALNMAPGFSYSLSLARSLCCSTFALAVFSVQVLWGDFIEQLINCLSISLDLDYCHCIVTENHAWASQRQFWWTFHLES